MHQNTHEALLLFSRSGQIYVNASACFTADLAPKVILSRLEKAGRTVFLGFSATLKETTEISSRLSDSEAEVVARSYARRF